MNAMQAYEKLSKLDYSELDDKIDQSKLNGNTVLEARTEWMKFMALCASDTQPNAPSKTVDEVWHPALLNTKFYQEVSKTLGVFIHHDQNVPKYAPHFDETVQKIQSIFGNENMAVWKSTYGNCGYGGCGEKGKVASLAANCGYGGCGSKD